MGSCVVDVAPAVVPAPSPFELLHAAARAATAIVAACAAGIGDDGLWEEAAETGTVVPPLAPEPALQHERDMELACDD